MMYCAIRPLNGVDVVCRKMTKNIKVAIRAANKHDGGYVLDTSRRIVYNTPSTMERMKC